MTAEQFSHGQAERALRERRLLELWETVDAARRLSVTAETAGSLRVGVFRSSLDTLGRWLSVFADEIELLRQARNSVAHLRPISDDNLEAAIQIGERLVELLPAEVRSALQNARGSKNEMERQYLAALDRLTQAQARVDDLFRGKTPSLDQGTDGLTKAQVDALLELKSALDDYTAKRDRYYAGTWLYSGPIA